ncbi:MAG: hypothetical protein ACRYFZ_05085 [Janthinobacterium lividum]
MSLVRLPFRRAYLALAVSLLAVSCTRKDDAAPTGAIAGTMAPAAGVGRLLSASAIAADKTTYTATPDAQTGAFNFPALPPGRYEVHFTTTAAKDFPNWVVTTVVAGATATPRIPLITHDNIGRGTMKWAVGGKAYAATEFKVYQSAPSFSFLGRVGSLGTAADAGEVGLLVPEGNAQYTGFAGVGTYQLGGGAQPLPPAGYYTYYAGGTALPAAEYMTPPAGVPTGSLHLTRFDAELGIATGTFDFTGLNTGGSSTASLPNQVAVSQGEFDITF